MPRKVTEQIGRLLSEAKARLVEPTDVESTIEKLGIGGNAPQARRAAASAETYPFRAAAFKRLAGHLLAMAPGRPRKVQRAVMFYVPDGAYQMQVFAIDDGPESNLSVCCEDVIKTAVSTGLVTHATGNTYRIGESKLTLTIEAFDGKTENQPPYINAMTGWNRRAMRITLPPEVQREQVDATLLICALSAASWRTAAAKA